MRVCAKRSKVLAGVQVVAKIDAGGQVGARVESARPLSTIEASLEGVLEDPVGAAGRAIEALCRAVTGIVDAIFEEQVDCSHDTGYIDAWEVAHASTIAGWGLEVWEAVFGDLAAADGEVVVFVV